MPPLTHKSSNSRDARPLRPHQSAPHQLQTALPTALQTAFRTPDARTVRPYRHRTHLPALAQFSTIDRKAHDYTFQNPYLYCAGNPIMFIDPSGLDNIHINQYGSVDRVDRTDDETDTFYILDSNNEIQENVSLTVEKGTIKYDYEEQAHFGNTYSLYEADNDVSGSQFFEFLADNTGVEYNLFQTGNTPDGTNYITTSHHETANFGTYFALKIRDMGLGLRNFAHNHPGLTMPSGMTSKEPPGDIQAAADLNRIFNSNEINYSVYMKDTGLYIPYNEFSRKSYYNTINLNRHGIVPFLARKAVGFLSKINFAK